MILLITLLRRIHLHAVAFADDVKFTGDVSIHSLAEVQADIETLLTAWSEKNDMPLSIEKCANIHCSKKQPNFNYNMQGMLIPVVNKLIDLSLQRSSDGGYKGHCAVVASKADKLRGAIRRSFQLKSTQLLWPAFQA